MKKILFLCGLVTTSIFSHELHQNSRSLFELLSAAQATQIRIIAMLNTLPIHAEIIDPNIKGIDTINRLLKTRWHGDASGITDYARATIVVESFSDIYSCLDELKKRINILSIDDHYAVPFPEMYRDINVIFEDPINGHIGEIQINSQPMISFKNSIGHDLFDRIRIIRAQEQLEYRKLTAHEIRLIEELTLMSKQGYNNAFQKSHLGTRIGVYGICIHDNQVLMVKTQSGSKTIYNFPGGGAEDFEGFVEALKRECFEELGCSITVRKLICVSDRLYKHPDFNNNSFHLYYDIVLDGPIDTSIQEARWVPLDNFPLDMMLEIDKSMIKSFNQQL